MARCVCPVTQVLHAHCGCADWLVWWSLAGHLHRQPVQAIDSVLQWVLAVKTSGHQVGFLHRDLYLHVIQVHQSK